VSCTNYERPKFVTGDIFDNLTPAFAIELIGKAQRQN